MKKHLTEKEIRDELKKITVICDTKEQVNYNITSFLSEKKIPYIKRSLDVGDYSFMVDDITFEDEVAIERKANLDELAGNISYERKRFENEFLRAKAKGTKVFLLVENAVWTDIESHNYKSKLLPKSLLGTLLSWQVRYNITIMFCKQSESAKLIYSTLYYWMKNHLEH